MSMQITSSAFAPGQAIPKKYTQDGQNISPPLHWSGVPKETRELALLLEDPDAPKTFPNPFVHWVLYKLPPSVAGVNEKVPPRPTLQSTLGALQGKKSTMQGTNSAEKIGYVGMAPPPGHGMHHYLFKLYALDTSLDIPPGIDSDSLKAIMSGHILEEAQLVGTYEKWAVVNRIKMALMGRMSNTMVSH
jgi:Raf kinase inhibitor-like YbhB/YbcL family protein